DPKKAHRFASEMIEKDPNRARAYYHRGLASYRAGNFDEALSDLDEAAKIDNPQYGDNGLNPFVYAARGDWKMVIESGRANEKKYGRIGSNATFISALLPWLAFRELDKPD